MIERIFEFFEFLWENVTLIILGLLAVVLFVIIVYTGCQAVGAGDDDNLSYGISDNRTYAIVMDNAGNVKKEGKIKRWCRTSRYNTIDIEFEDGSIYTTSAVNVILICEEDLK